MLKYTGISPAGTPSDSRIVDVEFTGVIAVFITAGGGLSMAIGFRSMASLVTAVIPLPGAAAVHILS